MKSQFQRPLDLSDSVIFERDVSPMATNRKSSSEQPENRRDFEEAWGKKQKKNPKYKVMRERVIAMCGDRIRLSVKNREIALLVSEEELARRAKQSPVVEPTADRGYRKLFLQTVTQADQGVDFDFLQAVNKVGKAPEK